MLLRCCCCTERICCRARCRCRLAVTSFCCCNYVLLLEKALLVCWRRPVQQLCGKQVAVLLRADRIETDSGTQAEQCCVNFQTPSTASTQASAAVGRPQKHDPRTHITQCRPAGRLSSSPTSAPPVYVQNSPRLSAGRLPAAAPVVVVTGPLSAPACAPAAAGPHT